VSPRIAGGVLGLLVALLIGMLVISTVVEGAARWRPAMIGAGVLVGAASLAMLVMLLRALSRTARGEEAESDFESGVLRQLHAAPPPVPAPRAPAAAAPAPEVRSEVEPAADGTPAKVDKLLAQLRFARLDPLHEGELRQGPLAGTALLRLGRGETAAVMARAPGVEDWPLLFPRFDRVFYPLADGRWACAERIESFVAARIDLKL
jgi:hypothetical protein